VFISNMSTAGENSAASVAVDEDKPILEEQNRAKAAAQLILQAVGNLPLQLLLFVGCIGTAVILLIGLVSSSSASQSVQDTWTIVFCLSLAVIEMFWWTCPICAPRFFILKFRVKLLRAVNSLTRASGKGSVTLYVGSVMLAKWELLDIISGIYMLAVGVLYFILGRVVEYKMKHLQTKQISFASVDKNSDGKIDIGELQTAAKEAGYAMSDTELYMAFALLDTDGDGIVSVEEFEYFFNQAKFQL